MFVCTWKCRNGTNPGAKANNLKVKLGVKLVVLRVRLVLVRLHCAEMTMPYCIRRRANFHCLQCCVSIRKGPWKLWFRFTVCHPGRIRLQASVPTLKKRMCLQHWCNLPRLSHGQQQVQQKPLSWPRAGEAHSDARQGVGPEKWTRCEGHYGNRRVVCQGCVNSKEQRTPAWGCERLANQTWAHHLGNRPLKYTALCNAVWIKCLSRRQTQPDLICNKCNFIVSRWYVCICYTICLYVYVQYVRLCTGDKGCSRWWRQA